MALLLCMSATAWAQPRQIIRPGDRVLFVGDELTQQMFYTRAVATALMSLQPDGDLRFFNGGREGATVADATVWIDDLMGMVQPSVVFICLGSNDAHRTADPGEMIGEFLISMTQLLDQVVAHPSVREVVLIGPQPIQSGLSEQLQRGNVNHTLFVLSNLTEQLATARRMHFVNLFDHMKAVYLAQQSSDGESLTIGGRLPSEQAHMIIASVVLRDIGISHEQMQSIDWSPLLPLRMRRVRQVLAIPMTAPDMHRAQLSHELYMSMARFDESFFRMWRLPNRHSGDTAPRLQGEQAWMKVRQDAAALR